MSHVRPIMPLGPVNNTAPVTTVSQARAVQAQAQVTGAENNYSLQSNLQTQKNLEARKRNAQDLIGSKLAIGTLEALEALPDMKGSHNEDDDAANAGRGMTGRRRKKRIVPVPKF